MTIVVVNVGIGNVGSVANMLRRLGQSVIVTDEPEEIARAERLVLPGVGAFDVAMRNLEERALVDLLTERVVEACVPTIGLCVGMQLLADSSEEGRHSGLGWVGGTVRRLPTESPQGTVRVPHMGWNRLLFEEESPLLEGLSDDARFYFVHSYYVVPDDPTVVVARARHGIEFPAIVVRGNITGVQFHPEKSHRHGAALLTAWLAR